VHQSGTKQVVFGVRGDTHLELTVFGPKRPLHSGHYGNWVPNPAMELSRLLSSMKNEKGEVTIKGFYDDVIDALDKLVEATQGSKGIIGHVDLSCKDESVEMIKCLTEDANWISKNRSKIASGVPALENIVDEIVAVYLSTIYKLKNLS
jgi:acetylornithine deacetylase/succinyl-diaminopimelate desuccinylase-like protein